MAMPNSSLLSIISLLLLVSVSGQSPSAAPATAPGHIGSQPPPHRLPPFFPPSGELLPPSASTMPSTSSTISTQPSMAPAKASSSSAENDVIASPAKLGCLLAIAVVEFLLS